MGNFKEDIARIRAFVFDVDGVMTDGGITVTPEGEFLRTFYAKDGYALSLALKKGYRIAIITGGRGKALQVRFDMIGIEHVYTNCHHKLKALHELRDIWGIGCRYGRMFDGMDIRTALQFVQLSREWVHARMGVTGLRMWNELQGVECIAFEQMPPQKQQITISRSFLREI